MTQTGKELTNLILLPNPSPSSPSYLGFWQASPIKCNTRTHNRLHTLSVQKDYQKTNSFNISILQSTPTYIYKAKPSLAIET